MAGNEEGEVGFEEGISWLPSHVLDEAIWDGSTKDHFNKQYQQQHQYRSRRPKLPFDTVLPRSKSGPKAHNRTKYHGNWASGAPGVQAIFIESGKKSCGTGVFLPQMAGTKLQSSKKPDWYKHLHESCQGCAACSPVLLPARIVQALNLNMHEVGLQVSPRQDANKKKSEGITCNSVKNKNGKNVSTPEIYLPKEWTY